MTRPATAGPCERSGARSLACEPISIAARCEIEQRVQQIDCKVDQHDQAGGNEKDSEQQVDVSREQRFVGEQSKSGPRKNSLNDDRRPAAHRLARLPSSEPATPRRSTCRRANLSLRQTFGARSDHVVHRVLVEYRSAHQPRVEREVEQRQRDRRQNQVVGNVDDVRPAFLECGDLRIRWSETSQDGSKK